MVSSSDTKESPVAKDSKKSEWGAESRGRENETAFRRKTKKCKRLIILDIFMCCAAEKSHTHTHANTHTHTDTHTHTQTHAHTHTHAHANTHRQTHTHTQTRARARTHTHTSAHTHKHTRTHAYVHIQGGSGT